MIQVTLVSLYGDKQSDLAGAISKCQELVAQAVGKAFRPYDLRQIHATLVGLEDISIAAYDDDRLPSESTRTWSVANSGITGDFVARLYT